jgi:hypothetical protein
MVLIYTPRLLAQAPLLLEGNLTKAVRIDLVDEQQQ